MEKDRGQSSELKALRHWHVAGRRPGSNLHIGELFEKWGP